MKRDLKGLATEAYMPYLRSDVFVPYDPPNSLPFPGPGWHKGPAVQSDLPPGYNTNEGRIMSNYGRFGDQPFSTVVGPVRAPNASFYRPGGVGEAYVGPAPYIPPGLPGPIYPNVGWHVGPGVFVDRINEEDDGYDYSGADAEKRKGAERATAVAAIGLAVALLVLSL